MPRPRSSQLRSPAILRDQMGDAGITTQDALARRAGCHPSMIGHLLSGDRASCSDELASRIAAALHVPVEAVFKPSPTAGGVKNSRNEVAA